MLTVLHPAVLDLAWRERYWNAVRECLETLFGESPADADRLVRQTRENLPRTPADAGESEECAPAGEPAESDGLLAELVYHAEPWHVARDLAKQDVRSLSDEQQERYGTILKRSGLTTAD